VPSKFHESAREMTISLQWIKEIIDLDWSVWDVARVSHALTDLGLEVEHADDQAAALGRFVVGFVTDRQPHPKADKLSVCTVDVGEDSPKTIVCGAPNVAAGQYVPVALDGAVVPNGGFSIGRRTLRGVESNGMICSKAELNLGEDHDGIWVLGLTPDALPVGQALATFLGKTDVIMELGITPNRADCLSHTGVARDLAALTGGTLRLPDVTVPAVPSDASSVTVQIADPTLCRRFMVRRIDGVRVVESPQWLKDRLTSIGLRPRNAIVDVTNYVMHECGQPLHAYDAATITDGTFVVQTAGAAGVTSYTTLDSKHRTLEPSMLLICDAAGPVGVAGVMGGEHSEITDGTTSVLLESAWFNPTSVRRTAKQLGLSTDASYRFERGVDIDGVEWALDRAAQLICELAGGVAADRVDAYPLPLAPIPFDVRFDRVRMINGVDVSNETIVSNCKSVGCIVSAVTQTQCTVTAPSWRVDVTSEIDIVEEVMRLYGVNNIPVASHARIAMMAPAVPDHLQRSTLGPAMRSYLIDRGCVECRTTVQTSPEMIDAVGHAAIRLKNPLGLEYSALRTSLIPNLVLVAGRNLRHGADTVRIVEQGKVMTAEATSDFGIREDERIGIVLAGAAEQHWSGATRNLDFYDVTGLVVDTVARAGLHDVVLQPDTAEITGSVWSDNRLAIMRGTERIGTVGQVEPGFVATADIDVAVFAAEWTVRTPLPAARTYNAVGAYPAVRRDVAFVVDDAVTAGDIMATVRQASTDLVRNIDVFDVYRDKTVIGEGKKSLGITITVRSDERTLVDADVDAIVSAIISSVQSRHHATIRGAA